MNKNINLKKKSYEIRLTILETIYSAKTGHIGGSYSCIDILVALYFGKIINFNPKKPKLKNRDRFILSKGHATAALYSLFAHLDFITFKELTTYCKNNTYLSAHPSHFVPGVEFDTGSLGHGLGIGCGISLAAKKDKIKFKTIVLLSDGELYEGSTWEALLFASQYQLNNLIIIVDRNRQIVMDKTEKCMRIDPLKKKLENFNFFVKEINGHNFKSLLDNFSLIKQYQKKKPLIIIANTIKGKGVSFMEGNIKWHHSVPNDEQYLLAKKELTNEINKINEK